MSGSGNGKRARTQLQKEMGFLLIIKQTKTTPYGKNRLAGWTRLDRTQDTSNIDKPTRNCKHKEIIKGANEEGNEGEQLGKINQ